MQKPETANKHILLVSPPSRTDTERFYIPCNEIPLNLCYLAAFVENQGFTCDVLDFDVIDSQFSFESFILKTTPAIIGFTSFSPFIKKAAAIAAIAKSTLPSALTVVGGYHATAFPQRTLEEFTSFDVLAFGEGEQTLVNLAILTSGASGSLTNIPGIAFRQSDSIIVNDRAEQISNIDTIPFPARNKIPLTRYVPNPVNYMKLPTTAILASRGCRFGCTFCSRFLFKGERVRSAENILEEMLQCDRDLGMRDFRFYDDNFTWHRDNCMNFCRLAPVKAPHISWNCFSRVDCIDEELLRAMKAAGCYQIKYGVETGSEQTLKAINKNITFDQSRGAISLARKVGVECQISMMIGLPDETADDVRRTIQFAIELSPDLILFNVFKPIPGSVLYNKLEKDGRLLSNNWEDYLVKTPSPVVRGALPAAELETLLKQAYSRFYFRPSYMAQRLKWLFRNPSREIRRYVTAARIFSQTFFGGGNARRNG